MTVLGTVVHLLLCGGVFGGGGRLLNPPGRGSLWREGVPSREDYDDHRLNCGGVTEQWQRSDFLQSRFHSYNREAAKMAGPLRKKKIWESFFNVPTSIKEGGGGKALIARQLREELFFAASLREGVNKLFGFRAFFDVLP